MNRREKKQLRRIHDNMWKILRVSHDSHLRWWLMAKGWWHPENSFSGWDGTLEGTKKYAKLSNS